MEIEETKLKGVFIVKPAVFKDERGYFFESFNLKHFNAVTGVKFEPVQDNESKSKRGVLRGLHFQKRPFSQAKLVRVVKGSVYDVAVDLRPDSDTFGEWTGVELTEENHKQFFIPKGFAHGFVVISDEAVFQYKCDDYWCSDAEDGIAWDSVGIPWTELTGVKEDEIILSGKDKFRKTLQDFKNENNII